MAIIAKTDRLIIRDWIPDQDAEQAYQIYSDPEVTRFLITKVNSVEAAHHLLQRWVTKFTQLNNGNGLWAIVHKETEEIVGTIILIQLPDGERRLDQDYEIGLAPDHEIGWHLKRSVWGNGYATEAAKAIINYAFNTLKIPVIYSVVHPQNIASIRVIQRLRMSRLGRTNRHYGLELEMFKLERSHSK